MIIPKQIEGDTEIPDCFDPDAIYQVRLDRFEGPLELLLHLIKKNEVDIYDIPISIITRQYLEYIKILKELNLEIAGEFLVMASTLLQIKSQMLLPSVTEDETSSEEEDPRAELIRRLLEYQKFKEAANMLESMDQTGRDLFVCRLNEPETESAPEEDDVPEIELFELIEAFRSVLKGIPVEKYHEIKTESINIADRINWILSVLQEKGCMRFFGLFDENPCREDIIANLLALLELCKRKMIRIVQPGLFGEMWIHPSVLPDDADSVAEEDIAYV